MSMTDNTPSFDAVTSLKNFTAAQNKQLASNVEAYLNLRGQPGAYSVSGKIIKGVNFAAAHPSRWVPGRGKSKPTHIVLARTADTLGTGAANIGNYVSTTAQLAGVASKYLTGHVVVGLDGGAIQLVDLQDSAVFVNGSHTLSKKAASALQRDAVTEVIAFTVAHETGSSGNSYAAVNLNDAGTGVAYGCVQFNQNRGTLFKLLNNMRRADQTRFDSIFGSDFISYMPFTGPADKKKPKSIHSDNINLRRYASQLKKAAEYRVFQKEQEKLAKADYWDPIASTARSNGIVSQRGYAILFDAAIQMGPGRVSKWMRSSEVKSKSNEKDKLREFAILADSVRYANKRRHQLLNNPRLSDAPLGSTRSMLSTEVVSDDNSIFIVLEGKTGDPVTPKQILATARVIRTCADEYGIPVSFAGIVGLDMLNGAAPEGSNPGEAFKYYDIINATLNETKLTPADRFLNKVNQNELNALNAQPSILYAMTSQVTRADRMFIDTAASTIFGAMSASRMSTSTRGDNSRGATIEAQARINMSNVRAATLGIGQSSLVYPQVQDPEALTGLLFDFDKGEWSDGKSGGERES